MIYNIIITSYAIIVLKMKKRIKIYYVLILSLCLFSCKENKEYGNSILAKNIELTEFQSVISNPKAFFNDTIRIKGQISMSSHNVSITDGISWIWIDSFEPALDFNTIPENLNMQQVEIIGIYDFRETGFMEIYVGKFTDVHYIKQI